MSLRYIDGQEPWERSDRIEGVRYSLKHLLALEAPALEALGLEPIPVPEPVVTPPSTDPNDYPLDAVQFNAMIMILGKVDDVDAAIDSIPDDTTRAVAKAKRQFGTRFDRDDPLFDQLAPAVWPNETAAQRTAIIDTAWMQAKEIV